MVRYFVECPLTRIHLMFFSQLDWSNGFPEGKPQSAILIRSCQVFILSISLITVDGNLDLRAEVVFVRSLRCRVTILFYFNPPFPYCILCKKVIMCSRHLRSGELWFPGLKVSISINDLKFFWIGDLSILSHLFICLFIHSFTFFIMDPWVFIFILWVII